MTTAGFEWGNSGWPVSKWYLVRCASVALVPLGRVAAGFY